MTWSGASHGACLVHECQCMTRSAEGGVRMSRFRGQRFLVRPYNEAPLGSHHGDRQAEAEVLVAVLQQRR
jgi:hypothetical protein